MRKTKGTIKKGVVLILYPFVLIPIFLLFATLLEKNGFILEEKVMWLVLAIIELLPVVGIGVVIYGIVCARKLKKQTLQKPKDENILLLGYSFDERPDVLQDLRLKQKNISDKNISLRVIHHRLRSAWYTPSQPNGVLDDAVEVFDMDLSTDVVNIIDTGTKTQKILVLQPTEKDVKCLMKSCYKDKVYEDEFSCPYNKPYIYHENLCDAMESWEFIFEKK